MELKRKKELGSKTDILVFKNRTVITKIMKGKMNKK